MRTTVFWMTCGPGRLGVLPRPRGHDWLEDEARGLRDQGVDVVVSLLTPQEERELGLLDEPSACRAVGIRFVSHPVPDRGLPASAEEFKGLAHALAAEVDRGASVAVHCRQGVGRAGMLAAGILAAWGALRCGGVRAGRRRQGVHGP